MKEKSIKMETNKDFFRSSVEKEFFEKLISSDIPGDKIAYEYKLKNNYIPDFVVFDKNGINPVAIFEVTTQNSPNLIGNINKLKKMLSSLPIQTLGYLVLFNKDGSFSIIEVNDFTTIENINKNKISSIPSYEIITQGFDKKIASKKEKDRQSVITALRIICWIIIPVIVIAVIILVKLNILDLSNQLLILLGGVAVAILIPCFKEISIGNFEMKICEENKKDNNSK